MSSLSKPAEWLLNFLKGWDNGKVTVTPETMMGLPSVWYAVNRISGHVGQLPINCHRRLDRGAEYAQGHPANNLLRGRPNDYQTPLVFKRQLTAHALLWGNGRAAIVRSGNQRMTELVPLMPDRTRTIVVQGQKYHVTKPKIDERVLYSLESERDEEGYLWEQFEEGRDVVVIHDDDVLHIPGFSFDGICGVSLFEVARKSMGNQLSTLNQVESQSRKGPTVRMMLQAPPGAFRDEKRAIEFLEGFRKNHQNDNDGETIGMLRDGVTANVMTMNNRDAQFIEQRLFDRQDSALWFMLESILGDDQSVSYNSLEQKNLAYLSNCLNTWLVTWEEECNAKLLTVGEQKADSHYFKFNTGPLLRSDMATTITTLGNAISNKIMNPNEAREKLDMNPYDGGDKFTNPAIDKTEQESSGKKDTKAVENHLRHLIGVECKRLKASATKKGFVAWAEEFYRGWQAKLGEAIKSFGGDVGLAADHCDESWTQLIECVAVSKDLPKDIAALVESWPNRAVKLSEQV